MRDHASLGNQLWFLLLRFFRDVIIIFSDCDGIKSFKCESSLWRLVWCICRSYILWWKDIFKISFIHTHVFFSHERFDSASKVVRERLVLKRFHLYFEEKSRPWSSEILRKWTTARLFRTVWPRVIHRKKRSVALSRSVYVVLRLTNF